MPKQVHYKDVYQWHDWFAWYPVSWGYQKHEDGTYSIKKAWWEIIQRRKQNWYGGSEWLYREKEENNND